jgi:predicted ATPase
LHGHLTAASERRGRLVVVCGEAGIGKTRLVTEFAGQARRRGATVLSGGSAAHGRDLTHGAFAVALENYLASRGGHERAELARRCPALARCVPSLGAPLAPPIDPREDDRAVVESAMVWLLSHIGAKRTACLLLGDLDDVDPAGLDVLRYLAHLAVQRRWLVIGTVREDELRAGSELKRMLDVAERERLCARVDLERLPRPECDRLGRSLLPGGAVGADVLHAVYERTLGNPLYVEEVLQDMREQAELSLSGGRWQAAAACADRVPSRIRALALARVETLSDCGRDALALAVASGGDSVTLGELSQAATALVPPISLANLYDGVDDALRSGVLEARGEAYAFRHPLVRAALYATLGQHRRKQLEMAYGRGPVKRQRLRLLAPVSVAGRDSDESLRSGDRQRLTPGKAGIALEHAASRMRV